MRREPGRAEAKWLTADAEAPRASAAACEPPLFAPRALSRRNELDEKDFLRCFCFSTPATVATRRVVLFSDSSSVGAPCASDWAARTNVAGACACVTKWRTLLTRLLSPGALVCFVTTKDVLHLLVCALLCFSWSRGHSVAGKDCCTVGAMCACCVVSLSGCLLHLIQRGEWSLLRVLFHNRCRLKEREKHLAKLVSRIGSLAPGR